MSPGQEFRHNRTMLTQTSQTEYEQALAFGDARTQGVGAAGYAVVRQKAEIRNILSQPSVRWPNKELLCKLEPNGPQVLLVMKRPQVPLVQESRTVLPSLSRVCDARDRNALTESRRKFPALFSSNGAVARGRSLR